MEDGGWRRHAEWCVFPKTGALGAAAAWGRWSVVGWRLLRGTGAEEGEEGYE